MAKKSKDDVPAINSVPNRDIIQRLNFLYQASVYLQGVQSPRSTDCPGPSKRRSAGTSDLAKAYIDTMTSVGRKATVKIDPAVKRTICQRCNSVMVPGRTLTVKVKRYSPNHRTIRYQCTSCHLTRRIPIDASPSGAVPADNESSQAPKAAASPFFARDFGHIVFRGTEMLAQVSTADNGIFTS